MIQGAALRREPVHAADREHDLVIVGGGIQGACVALEAAGRGLRPLLLERGDFGEATSWNSLRFLHGGVRYLQTLDLRRLRESVGERRWFCRTFPELVRPCECLMPLYGDGLKRPATFGAALLLNDLLSCDRNTGVDTQRRLPRGYVLSASETIERFPLVQRRGLRGAGVWYDAAMVNPQRILIEILRWACSLGATVLNYVEAVGLETRGNRVAAVRARDRLDGETRTYAARLVCNCAGPWSPAVAARFGWPRSNLFRPSLAFNVLFERPAPNDCAIAVASRGRGRSDGPVFFLCSAYGRLLAGTMHLPWSGGLDRPRPAEADLLRFLAAINEAVPGLDLRRDDIVRVFAGLLPSAAEGTATLAVRPVVVDHGREGGPEGLVSVAGVKFTTARLVAERALATLAGRLERWPITAGRRPPPAEGIDYERPGTGAFSPETLESLKRLVRDESVIRSDDLLLRRTAWGIVDRDLPGLRRRVCAALEWTNDKDPDDARHDSLAAAHVRPDAQEEAAAWCTAPRDRPR